METEENEAAKAAGGQKKAPEDTELKKHLDALVPSFEVKAAVLDTGIKGDDPLFEGRIIDPGINLSSSGGEGSTEDDNGHGTEMALIIATNSNEYVKIMPVKVADSQGRATVLNMYLGMKKAMECGAGIINISMNAYNTEKSALLSGAIEEAAGKGIYVIVSAGNNSANTKDISPGNIESAVVVSAVDQENAFAGYSNFGDTVDYCSYGTYGEKTGTSYAAANVAGILADALSKGTDMSVLDEYAIDLGDEGKDIYYGRGLAALSFMQEDSHKEENEAEKDIPKNLLSYDDLMAATDEELINACENSEPLMIAYVLKTYGEDVKNRLIRLVPMLSFKTFKQEYIGDGKLYGPDDDVYVPYYEYLESLDASALEDYQTSYKVAQSGAFYLRVRDDAQPGSPESMIKVTVTRVDNVVNGVTESKNTNISKSFTLGYSWVSNSLGIGFSPTSWSAHTEKSYTSDGHNLYDILIIPGYTFSRPICRDVTGALNGEYVQGYRMNTRLYEEANTGTTANTLANDPPQTSFSVGSMQVNLANANMSNEKVVTVGTNGVAIESNKFPDASIGAIHAHGREGTYTFHLSIHHNEYLHDRTGATCTASSTENYYCAWCGSYLRTTHDTAALGHAWPSGYSYAANNGIANGERYKNCNRCHTRLETAYLVSVTKGVGIASASDSAYYFPGAQVTLSASAAPGYKKIVWSGHITTGSFTMPGKAVSMTVTAEPGIFKITLNHQGGMNTVSGIYEKYTVGYFDGNDGSASGTAITSIPVPARTGYDFLGYYTLKDGKGSMIIDKDGKITAPNTQFTADAAAYACWAQQVYTMELDSGAEGKEADDKGTETVYEWYSKGFYQKYSQKKVSDELPENAIKVPAMRMEEDGISRITDGAETGRKYFFNGYFDKDKKIINGESKNGDGDAGVILIPATYYTDENTADRKVTLKAEWIPQKMIFYHKNFSEKMSDAGMTEEMLKLPETLWKEPAVDTTIARSGEDDAEVTDEGYAPLCRFLGWNTMADGTGEWVKDRQVTDDDVSEGRDIVLYAQWEISYDVAYIGNVQTEGADFTDDNEGGHYIVEKDAIITMSAKNDEEEYPLFKKKEENSFVNRDGEAITQEVDCSVAGWSFYNTNDKNLMYETKSEKPRSELLLEAKTAEAGSGTGIITYGAPNADFGSHDAPYQDERGTAESLAGSLMGIFPKGEPEITLSNFAERAGAGEDDAWQTPVINLYAVWDKGPVIDAEEELFFTLNEAKRGDITEEELLKYADAWDAELEGKTPEGYFNKGEDSMNGTTFDVCDYDPRQFTVLEHKTEMTILYRAVDSIGNVTYKKSTVYVVDTAPKRDTEAHTRENARKYLRAISAEYLWTLDEDSIWNTDPEYHQLLLDALDPDVPPQYRMEYTHEDVLRMKEANDMELGDFWDQFVEPFIVERN